MRIKTVATIVVGMMLNLGLIATVALGVDCTNTAATNAGTTTTTGGGTQICTDGTSCGHTNTYNPPDPTKNPCIPMPDWCCVDQMQSAYTQTFSCTPDPLNPAQTKCTGGAKQFNATKVAVKISVPCTGKNPATCTATPDFYE